MSVLLLAGEKRILGRVLSKNLLLISASQKIGLSSFLWSEVNKEACLTGCLLLVYRQEALGSVKNDLMQCYAIVRTMPLRQLIIAIFFMYRHLYRI